MAVDWSARVYRRVDEVRENCTADTAEWNAWLDEHGRLEPLRRFGRHFEVLRTVLNAMGRAVDTAVESLSGDIGAVYAKSRQLDGALVIANRLFRWYADKYEQRLNQAYAPTLEAADALIRSCWVPAFPDLELQTPTPLAFMDQDVCASAILHKPIPPELRSHQDETIAPFIAELPIALIGLPANTARRSWWVVIAAHEVAHHLEKLQPSLQDTLRDSVAKIGDGFEETWLGWRTEIFADAFAVVVAGPGIGWAVEELLQDTLPVLVRAEPPGSRYPPLPIRLALIGEIARHVGYPSTLHDAGSMMEWLSTNASGSPAFGWLSRHLAQVPEAAALLASLPMGVSPLSNETHIAGWSRKLCEPIPTFTNLTNRSSARVMIAAGVRAYQQLVANRSKSEELDHLHTNLSRHLGQCGTPGVLGPEATGAGLTSLAERLAHRLVSRSVEVE